MKNVRKYSVRIGLILMILLSLFLLLKISMGVRVSQPLEKEGIAPSEVRSRKELLLPTQAYIKTQKEVYFIGKEQKLKQILEQTAKNRWGSFRCITKNVEKEWTELHRKANWLELQYAGSMDYDTFANTYHFPMNTSLSDLSFAHVFYDWERKELYFLDKKYKALYLLELKGTMQPTLEEVKEKVNHNFVVEYLAKDIYGLKEKMELPNYRYLTSVSAYTLFLQTLFSNSGNMTTKGEGPVLDFRNENGENLCINNQTGIVHFQKPKIDDENIDHYFLEVVGQLGSTIGPMRYFTNQNLEIQYRCFVEGHPIFAPNYGSSVVLKQQERQLDIWLNQINLQLPLPCNSKTKVESAKEVWKKLCQRVNEKDIQDMKLGYHWKKDKENDQAVLLVPTWFVEYKGQWKEVDEIINKRGTR